MPRSPAPKKAPPRKPRDPAPKKRPKEKPAATKKRRKSSAPELSSLSSLVVETKQDSAGAGSRRPMSPEPGDDPSDYGYQWTAQLEYVNCGKCPRAHGPYWYAYKRGGSLVKVYIGKTYNHRKAQTLLFKRGFYHLNPAYFERTRRRTETADYYGK